MSTPKPAYAVCCNLGAVISKLNEIKQEVITTRNEIVKTIKEKIIGGDSATSKPIQLGKNSNGTTITAPPSSVTFKSLAEYFENVWWPKRIALQQVTEYNDQAMKAGLDSVQASRDEAQQQIDHTQQVKRDSVQAAASVLGLPETACPVASINQSSLAAAILADQIRSQEMEEYLAKVGGSSDYPNWAIGPIGAAKDRREARASTGVCDPKGNMDANKEWCTSGKPELANWDWNPDVILGTRTLSTDASDKHSVTIADMFVENLSPEINFPVRKDLMGTPEVDQFLDRQARYNTRRAMLLWATKDMKASTTGLGNLAATNSLNAVLSQAGITGETIKLYDPGTGLSENAIDEIRYKTYMTDPQTIVNFLSPNGALSEKNTLLFSATMQMNMVSLLYDIREAIRVNSMIAGAAGLASLNGEFKDLTDLGQRLSRN